MKVIIKMPFDWETFAWVVIPPASIFAMGIITLMALLNWPGCE